MCSGVVVLGNTPRPCVGTPKEVRLREARQNLPSGSRLRTAVVAPIANEKALHGCVDEIFKTRPRGRLGVIPGVWGLRFGVGFC